MSKARRLSKMQSRSEWRLHATNLVTNDQIVMSQISDREFVYRVEGSDKVYSDFKQAFLKTMPYGNAEKQMIILHAHWRSTSSTPYYLYTPGGVLLGKHATFDKLKEMANSLSDRFPPASEEEAKERKRLYLRNIEKKHEAKRRVMIEREKQKILAEREREMQLKKIEEKYGDSMGSW